MNTSFAAVPRPRRSCLAVPGSNPRFLEKARGLPADQVFLDLEDACAPLAKPGARKNIVAALNEGGWGDKIRVVRVNDWTTHWTYRDVIEVVEGAGANLDCVMLPKVQNAEQVVALDLLLTQIEKTVGLRGRPDRHRGADRERAGPDRRRRDRQGQPAGRDDHLRPGRLHGLDQHEVAGGRRAAARLRRRRRLPPHPDVDPDGRPRERQAGHRRPVPADPRRRRVPPGGRRARPRSASTASGCCTPTRSTSPTRSTRPSQDDYDHAELILDAYDYYTSEAGGAKGSAMLGDEMIDEASRKMALVISAKGRAAGMTRTSTFSPPTPDRHRASSAPTPIGRS